MAPISIFTAGPLSIITGALLGTFSGPNSVPSSNGTNATVWGTQYKGTASFLNLTLDSTLTPTSSLTSSPTSSTSSSLPSPISPVSPSSSSSLVYFNSTANSYTGCNNQTFSSTDSVALINSLQFGSDDTSNSTCGNWIQITNRGHTAESTYAQIVGVCDDCEYGSVSLSLSALESLAPDLPFDQMIFDNQSDLTIANLTDPIQPLPVDSTPISPVDLLNIEWTLSSPPSTPSPSSSVPAPTTTTKTSTTKKATTTTATKTTTTKKAASTTSTSSGAKYSGRATWYSDTYGQCEKSYSQSDLIVAVNKSQMGNGKGLCGKKIRLSKAGSSTEVIVTVVDMCPGCAFGALDLSQAAFKKFAGLGVGVLQLQWSFV